MSHFRLCDVSLRFFSAVMLLTCIAAAPLAAQDDDDPKAIRDFNTAAELQNSGLYARAGEKWQQFVTNYKSDKRLDRATYNLGVCRLHTKKYDDSIKAFNEVAAKYKNFKSLDALRYNLGMAHYLKAGESQNAADYTAAAKAFGETAEKHPQSKYADRALYFQGEALYTTNAAEASRAAFAKLVSKYPNSSLLANAYYALGTAQQDGGMTAEAIKTYSAFLANDKLKSHEFAPEIRLRLAMSQFAENDFAAAEKNFEQVAAIAGFSHADFAMLRQAQCRYEQDDIAKAAELNLALVKKFPESQYVPNAQLAAGKCFYQSEKWNEAKSALEPLTKGDDPGKEEASYWLGRTYLRQDKPNDALSLLDNLAKQIAGDHAFAPHIKLARLDALYAIPDRRKETAGQYADFAKQYADHELAAQAQYMAALAALEQEDFAAARGYAEAFLQNDAWKETSFVPSVLFVAGESTLLADDDASPEALKAEPYYRRLVGEFSDDPRAPRSHLRIGWILYRQDKPTEAEQYLNGIVSKLSEAEHIAEARLLIGRSLLDAEKAGAAVAPLQQAIAAKNDWSRIDEALILLAQAYRGDDKLAEASQQLSRLESQYKQSPYRGHALYMLGEIAQEQAKWDEAATRYSAVLSQYADDPYAPSAAYGLGAARIAEEKYADAEQAFTNLLDKYDAEQTRSLATYWRGVARHRQQKFQPAVADLQQFVGMAKQSDDQRIVGKVADALYSIALCQVGLKQFDAASTTLASLLREHAGYEHRDRAYYELGHALIAQDKTGEAIDAFASLAKELPESPLAAEAFFHLGTAREKQAADSDGDAQRKAQLAAAEQAFAAGMKTAEEPALKEKLAYKLGDMQFRQDKFAEAAGTLQQQLADFPSGELAGPARYLTAESFFRQNQFDKALPLFEKVAADKVDPYIAQSFYRAGAAAGFVKNWQASEKAYRTLLADHADFPLAAEARYGLAWALQNQNEFDEAVKLYEQLSAKDTSETAAKARFMVGEIAFGKKEYEQAIGHFLETAAGYSYPEWQAIARLEAGRCFIQLNKPAEARKQFQIVVDKFPDHDKADDAARLLAELNK